MTMEPTIAVLLGGHNWLRLGSNRCGNRSGGGGHKVVIGIVVVVVVVAGSSRSSRPAGHITTLSQGDWSLHGNQSEMHTFILNTLTLTLGDNALSAKKCLHFIICTCTCQMCYQVAHGHMCVRLLIVLSHECCLPAVPPVGVVFDALVSSWALDTRPGSIPTGGRNTTTLIPCISHLIR
jgi:hypothetical protein